jgi:O-acetyl-ADP-ribose deacetylase (regulator of RNase III)
MIIHIVNNCGKWGKGFVLSLSKFFPITKDSYLSWFKSGFNMGDVQFLSVDDENRIFVANMLAQNGIKKSVKDSKKYICYESLENCLSEVSDFALKERLVVQLPMIGAGLGGGDWDTIFSIIIKKLSYNKIRCHIFKLS